MVKEERKEKEEEERKRERKDPEGGMKMTRTEEGRAEG